MHYNVATVYQHPLAVLIPLDRKRLDPRATKLFDNSVGDSLNLTV
jgi:hypothetical protein